MEPLVRVCCLDVCVSSASSLAPHFDRHGLCSICFLDMECRDKKERLVENWASFHLKLLRTGPCVQNKLDTACTFPRCRFPCAMSMRRRSGGHSRLEVCETQFTMEALLKLCTASVVLMHDCSCFVRIRLHGITIRTRENHLKLGEIKHSHINVHECF